MNKVIGAKGHPDSLSLNAKLFRNFARFVLPVRNLLNALAALIREVYQHDVGRHQNLPLIGLRTECHMMAVADKYPQAVQDCCPRALWVKSGHQFGLEGKASRTLYVIIGRRMPLSVNSPT